MPTYAYACKDCKHTFDVVQSFSEDSLTQCPQCQGRVRKKFGNVGIAFKGSGFYRNDSRAGADASTSAGDSASKESKSSGSGESTSNDTSTSDSKSGDTSKSSDSAKSTASSQST